MPLTTVMMPGCCGLKVLRYLGCLGKTDDYSKKDAERFDTLVNTGKAEQGEWATYGKAPDTVAIISTSDRYQRQGHEFEKQKKFLEDKGWVLLASWKSQESGGTNYLYGSPGIQKV